jgi:hypothetical protein
VRSVAGRIETESLDLVPLRGTTTDYHELASARHRKGKVRLSKPVESGLSRHGRKPRHGPGTKVETSVGFRRPAWVRIPSECAG